MTNLPWDSVAPLSPHPGIMTKRLDLAMMTVVLYEFEPGASFPLHYHSEEQLVVVLSGTAGFRVEDQVHPLKAGDSLHAPPQVPHGCEAGPEGCSFLNILAPRREPGVVIQYS